MVTPKTLIKRAVKFAADNEIAKFYVADLTESDEDIAQMLEDAALAFADVDPNEVYTDAELVRYLNRMLKESSTPNSPQPAAPTAPRAPRATATATPSAEHEVHARNPLLAQWMVESTPAQRKELLAEMSPRQVSSLMRYAIRNEATIATARDIESLCDKELSRRGVPACEMCGSLNDRHYTDDCFK